MRLFRDEDSADDELAPARAVVWALLIMLPFWAAVLAVALAG